MNHSFKNSELPAPGKIPTVFLPGWGFDGSILHLCKPSPAWIYPEELIDPATIEKDLLDHLDAINVRKVRIIGWSMGAMLALEIVARHKDLAKSLVLVSFRPQWPDHEMKEIRREFSQNPAAFLKNFYRKCFLGDKQIYRKFSTILENRYLDALINNGERLERGLDYLAEFKMPIPMPSIATRFIHGKQDVIAPVAEISAFPEAALELINNAGHAAFLHEDSSLQQELRKQVIQTKFSRAAVTYDSYAKVQAEVASKLAAKLPFAQKQPLIKTILEIGCGTGNFTSLLAGRFPDAKIIALDFSPAMIAIARRKLKAPAIEFVCAEGEGFLAESLDRSFDLVVSNGSLQWFANIEKTLSDIARILSTKGLLFCSVFGPDSLSELAAGLHTILGPDQGLAAEAFPSPASLQSALAKYFKEGKIEQEILEKTYRSTHDLLIHIKKTGTAGWQQRFQQPLTPSRITRLDAWFTRTYGACTVTYQILFLQGRV